MPAAVGNTKFCPRCKTTKTVDQFGRASARIDGLKPWCKACVKIAGAIDFQKHKAKRTAAHKKWAAAHPDEMAAYVRVWIKQNPEKRKAIDNRRNSARDPAQHCSEVMASYWRNPKKYLDRARKWRQANKDAVAAITRAYRQANPERIAALKRNYKARKNGAEGFHTGDDIKSILKNQKWLCVYCRTSLHDEYHADHIIPLSKGGNNWPDNMQCLCGPCNLRKKDKDPIEFARSLGVLL